MYDILLIEDDKTIALGITTYLKNDGYNVQYLSNLGDTADIDLGEFDLIILDVNLPDGSGFDYLEYVQQNYTTPVLLLTVRDSEDEILRGFELGAIEYVTKPFSMAVLKARIQNILDRRSTTGSINVGDLSLDPKSRTVRLKGQILDLSKQEYDVLQYLLENRGLTCPRENIIDAVWSGDVSVEDNTLTVTVKRLRDSLGEYRSHIKTVRGMGYRWE